MRSETILRISLQKLDTLKSWNRECINDINKRIGKELGLQMNIVNQVLRYAVAGLESGVGVHVIIEILGKERVMQRLDTCRLYEKGNDAR